MYGCCPYPSGSCCSDKVHCCPNDYSCDESGNRCIRHLNQIPSTFKLKSLLIKYSSKEDELCPDERTKCSSNSTCCPNKEKNEISYSCCPYSKVNYLNEF